MSILHYLFLARFLPVQRANFPEIPLAARISSTLLLCCALEGVVMNAIPRPCWLSAGLPCVQEATERVEPADQRLEAGFARWRADLARLAAALGIQAERREDVLQEVYLAARAKCPTGLEDDALRRWLFQVTANQCRLEHRRRQRWGKVFAALTFWRSDSTSVDSSERAEKLELTVRVESALGRLSAVEREIVVLRYFCDFDSSQIGEMLSLPSATVSSHLAKARRQLAKELADWK
jgi:RNA polymerase sigma factor (sigma-70 family)